MSLPVLDGWTVLDRLKRHPATRHIPVHIVSGMEERQPALMAGAAAFVQKPASLEALEGVFGGIESFIARDVRRLLVVDDDETQRDAIVELVGGDGDVEIVAVGSSEEALAALDAEPDFDCMVLDLKLPKMTGFDLLEKVKTTERSRAAAGDRLHRQGADPARGDEAEALRGDDRRQGRALAGAPARRDVALPAPRRVEAAGLEAEDARAAAQRRRALRRQEGADRRRRRPQRLRAHERARGARDGGALRRERARRDRGAQAQPATSTSC